GLADPCARRCGPSRPAGPGDRCRNWPERRDEGQEASGQRSSGPAVGWRALEHTPPPAEAGKHVEFWRTSWHPDTLSGAQDMRLNWLNNGPFETWQMSSARVYPPIAPLRGRALAGHGAAFPRPVRHGRQSSERGCMTIVDCHVHWLPDAYYELL